MQKRIKDQFEVESKEDLSNLWKVFGMESKVGKKLFNMYNKGKSIKPKIKYPKLKMKTKEDKENERKNQKKTKKCPQQTKIEYPPLSYKHEKMKPKYNPIDFVPQRKGKKQIMHEIESEYRNVQYDVKSGQDREKMKKELQKKLINPRKGDKALTEEEQLKVEEAIKKRKKQVERKYLFRKETKEEKAEKKEVEELNEMFEEVVKDIDERQAFLAEVEHLESEELQNKVKGEIVELIGELEKITNMIKKVNRKNKDK